MYKRWISIHEFRWTPILTFTRRQLRLLDWLEENVKPVAFLEDPGQIGIAIRANDLRLTIHRTGMIVESGVSDQRFEHLLPALGGVFELLEPDSTVLSFSNVISTFELADADYDEARHAFAVHLAGAPPEIAGLTAVDAANLIDLEAEDQSAQVEWGIVESAELLSRLNNPRVSRLHRPGQTPDIRNARQMQMAGGLPVVSIFAELVCSRLSGGEVTDADGVGDIINKVEDTARTVTLGFADRFNTAGDTATKEGATW